MLEILALAREDGWAFVRDGDRIIALHPPYKAAARREVSDAVVARAVGDHGFTPSGEKRADWSGVVDYLRDQIVQAREESGRKLPPQGVGRALLRHAPAETIVELLARVEVELLPGNEFSAAEQMLIAMLDVSPRVRDDAAMHARVVKLLDRVHQQRERVEQSKRALITTDARLARFPALGRNPVRLAACKNYQQGEALMATG